MNPVRIVALVAGVALLVLGTYMLYFAADLDRWLSIGVVTAGLLILIGLIVMSYSASARTPVVAGDTREVHHHEPEVRTREVYRDDRPRP